jgi:hypothetical protein
MIVAAQVGTRRTARLLSKHTQRALPLLMQGRRHAFSFEESGARANMQAENGGKGVHRRSDSSCGIFSPPAISRSLRRNSADISKGVLL